jgi:hypothetical protein
VRPIAQEQCGDTTGHFRKPPTARIVQIEGRRTQPALPITTTSTLSIRHPGPFTSPTAQLLGASVGSGTPLPREGQVLSMRKPKPTGVHLDCPARTVQAKAAPRLCCTSANSRKLVKGIRRAIARRLVDTGNMSPSGVRRRLRHQLMRLRITQRPGVGRARERMRMPRQIPRLRPRIALRRAVAIDEAGAA